MSRKFAIVAMSHIQMQSEQFKGKCKAISKSARCKLLLVYRGHGGPQRLSVRADSETGGVSG